MTSHYSGENPKKNRDHGETLGDDAGVDQAEGKLLKSTSRKIYKEGHLGDKWADHIFPQLAQSRMVRIVLSGLAQNK